VPGGAEAWAGRGGVANGYMTGWDCLTTTGSFDGQARKSPQHDRPHNSWQEANSCAQCGKSARWARCGGGWKRIHGLANDTPRGNGEQSLGRTFGTPRQSSTRPYRAPRRVQHLASQQTKGCYEPQLSLSRWRIASAQLTDGCSYRDPTGIPASEWDTIPLWVPGSGNRG
jgi:hypothetical protein